MKLAKWTTTGIGLLGRGQWLHCLQQAVCSFRQITPAPIPAGPSGLHCMPTLAANINLPYRW